MARDQDDLGVALSAWLRTAAHPRGLSREVDVGARHELSLWIRRKFPALDAATVREVADESLARVFLAISRGDIDPERPDSPGYVIRIARNFAIDQTRRRDLARSKQLAFAVPRTEDDAIAALLDRTADVDRVRAALAVAANDDQREVVRVVGTWLDLAAESSAPPSLRLVASKCDVSHTTVGSVLARFRDYLIRQTGERESSS